jgi:5-methylcytosine-specific restriction endonuclease McrA
MLIKINRYKTKDERKITAIEKKSSRYQIYLQSDYWKEVRQLVIKRDKVCQKCKSTKHFQVHHLTYVHYQKEKEHLEDLVLLCKNCHKQVHNL